MSCCLELGPATLDKLSNLCSSFMNFESVLECALHMLQVRDNKWRVTTLIKGLDDEGQEHLLK